MTLPSRIWCPNLSFGFQEFRLRTTACKTAADVFLRRWTVAPRLSTDTGYPSARCDLLPSRTVRTPCPAGTVPCPGFEQPQNVRQPRSDLQLKFKKKTGLAWPVCTINFYRSIKQYFKTTQGKNMDSSINLGTTVILVWTFWHEGDQIWEFQFCCELR